MKENALYYPYIDVPNQNWIFHTLLYWDTLYSIVPTDYIYEPQMHSPFMQEMLVHELVRPVTPVQYLGYEELSRFADFVEERARQFKPFLSRHRGASQLTQIHFEKFSDITERFVELGLAVPSGGAWYNMSNQLASSLMFFIANVIARQNEINADAVTWKRIGLLRTAGRHKVRKEILSYLLPLPEDKLSIKDVAMFKQKNGHLLFRFRRFVEDEVTRIQATVAGGEDYEDVKRDALRAMEERTAEVEDAIRNHWKKVFFKTICPLFAAGIPCIFDNVSPLFGLGGTIASQLYPESINFNREPLSYSVFAQRALIRVKDENNFF